MASNKNITMRQFNGTDYDYLYPKTTTGQVSGLYDNIYTKSQSDGLYLKTNGSNAMTGNLNVGNHYLSNVANPVSPQDGATKQYVDNQISNGLYSVNIAYNGNVNVAETTGDSRRIFMGSNEFNSTNAIGIAFTISVTVTNNVSTNTPRYRLYCGSMPIFFPSNDSDYALENFTELRISGLIPITGAQGARWSDHGTNYNYKYINILGNTPYNYGAQGFGFVVDSLNFVIPANKFQMGVEGMTFAGGFARTDVIYHR